MKLIILSFLLAFSAYPCLALADIAPPSTPPEAEIEAYLKDLEPEADTENATPDKVGVWEHKNLPNKTPAQFSLNEGAIEVYSANQFSLLRQKVDVQPAQFAKIAFSWRTEDDIPNAHTGKAGFDDSPARLLLVFDGDTRLWGLKDKMLSELSLLMTGEPLGYATLSYAWADAAHKVNEIIESPRTSRIKNWILEAGKTNTKKWIDYELDIHSHFKQAFGEAAGRLVQVMLMSDTDNTRSEARSAFRNIRLLDSEGRVLLQLQ